MILNSPNTSSLLPSSHVFCEANADFLSDFGSCSYICPGIQAVFNIGAKDAPHSVLFREAAGGEFAHVEALRAGKANALIGLDVLTNDDFACKMKKEFREAMRENGRESD